MSLQSIEIEQASLGELLRTTRINLGLDLNSIAEHTKISSKNLQAIESNDFALLPAEAFTRGFYMLYAKMLSLDCEAVLQRYLRERPKHHKSNNRLSLLHNKRAREAGNMAERPSFMPLSFFGLILILAMIFGGILCWFISWNPAFYLSQKLRSLDQNPHQLEEELESRYEVEPPEPVSWVAAIRQKGQRADAPALAEQTGNSLIHAAYLKEMRAASARHGSSHGSMVFRSGESAAWHMEETIVNVMHNPAAPRLTLNQTHLDLLRPDRWAATSLFLPGQSLQ